MKTVTLEQFLTFNPCWLEEEGGEERLREIGSRKKEWTALDVLALEEVRAEDRLWAVLREDFMSKNGLYEFALLCAKHALITAKVTDERCWNAIKVKRAWMCGEASDGELVAARAAARAAAREAARAAARDAARDAARAAAWDAADAAWASAWDAADAADAARKIKGREGYSHERAWQIETLKRMIVENEKEEQK